MPARWFSPDEIDRYGVVSELDFGQNLAACRLDILRRSAPLLQVDRYRVQKELAAVGFAHPFRPARVGPDRR